MLTANGILLKCSFRKYHRMFLDLAMQFMLDDRCLKDRMSGEKIDKLLADELKKEGINTPFRYAVFDNFSEGMLYGNLQTRREARPKHQLLQHQAFPQ